MFRPTDASTTLSLTATVLSDLFPEGFFGEEQLNGLGSFMMSGCSAGALTLDSAMATHLTLILHNDSQQRSLDALCAEIHQLPADATAEHYRVILRPWLWWLTLASNNRVFQNPSINDIDSKEDQGHRPPKCQPLCACDIVTMIFKAHGFEDYELKLSGEYPSRKYCVQYGETDFTFISRLLEEEGIFYFFTHDTGKHRLVLADNNDAFPPCPNGSIIPYLGHKIGERELHGIRSGQLCLQAVPGVYRATDYEFTTPTASLYGQADAISGALSIYDHPGGYTVKARGDALSKLRVDALRTQEKRFVGESDCRWLVPGHWFTLIGHDDAALNIDWVVTSVTHDASHEHYRNRFEAIPRSIAYRPPRISPKPRMHTQTALVVGKAGEEIWTDQYGRIKIQFPWDRDGKKNETISCWVRVALPWSGKGFGMQFIPRIGQEVIITFIDGDPDRPLVTGCVYNGDNVLPYALPANQTQSGIKTRSSKGGEGFNELRFEDKKNSEEVFLQAQKDLNINVLNDSSATIGHDETLTVKNARTRTVKEGDETITLEKGKRSITIQTGSDALDVKDTRTVKVGRNQIHSTGGNYTHEVTGNYELTVNGNLTIKVSGTLTLQSSGDFTARSDANLTNQSGLALTNKAGTELTNQAGTSLDNKAGTALTNDAAISVTSKAGATQTVDGGGMLILKGGIIKAN